MYFLPGLILKIYLHLIPDPPGPQGPIQSIFSLIPGAVLGFCLFLSNFKQIIFPSTEWVNFLSLSVRKPRLVYYDLCSYAIFHKDSSLSLSAFVLTNYFTSILPQNSILHTLSEIKLLCSKGFFLKDFLFVFNH